MQKKMSKNKIQSSQAVDLESIFGNVAADSVIILSITDQKRFNTAAAATGESIVRQNANGTIGLFISLSAMSLAVRQRQTHVWMMQEGVMKRPGH
mmetsp:Transcript_1892/g.3130  ORF Transcript_1892/g.3130 Transcript_1892/m.3130 type:complete len:95 (-) Transcript_1892:130-414(-)